MCGVCAVLFGKLFFFRAKVPKHLKQISHTKKGQQRKYYLNSKKKVAIHLFKFNYPIISQR